MGPQVAKPTCREASLASPIFLSRYGAGEVLELQAISRSDAAYRLFLSATEFSSVSMIVSAEGGGKRVAIRRKPLDARGDAS